MSIDTKWFTPINWPEKYVWIQTKGKEERKYLSQVVLSNATCALTTSSPSSLSKHRERWKFALTVTMHTQTYSFICNKCIVSLREVKASRPPCRGEKSVTTTIQFLFYFLTLIIMLVSYPVWQRHIDCWKQRQNWLEAKNLPEKRVHPWWHLWIESWGLLENRLEPNIDLWHLAKLCNRHDIHKRNNNPEKTINVDAPPFQKLSLAWWPIICCPVAARLRHL